MIKGHRLRVTRTDDGPQTNRFEPSVEVVEVEMEKRLRICSGRPATDQTQVREDEKCSANSIIQEIVDYELSQQVRRPGSAGRVSIFNLIAISNLLSLYQAI